MTKEQKEKWGNTLPVKGDWITSNSVRVSRKRTTSVWDDELSAHFQPIPLTPEVMERIREGKKVWGRYCIDFRAKKIHYELLVDVREGVSIHYGSREIPGIHHLHHLQQLYRLLTGKELTIVWT